MGLIHPLHGHAPVRRPGPPSSPYLLSFQAQPRLLPLPPTWGWRGHFGHPSLVQQVKSSKGHNWHSSSCDFEATSSFVLTIAHQVERPLVGGALSLFGGNFALASGCALDQVYMHIDVFLLKSIMLGLLEERANVLYAEPSKGLLEL